MKNIFTAGWELRYEAQFLNHSKDRIKAYICSPLRDDRVEAMQRNMLTAKAYMVYAYEVMNCTVAAPHAYLPVILDDDKPDERKLALQFGLQLLELSNIVLVCGNRISEGMKNEIKHAASLNKPIYTFNTDMYSEVMEIVNECYGDTELVSLHLSHSPLGSPYPVTNYIQTKLGPPSMLKENIYVVSV